MLREWKGVRQRPEEGPRRWFTDDDMDLIVWYSDGGAIAGFQLCYDKQSDQHAVTWLEGGSFTHHRIDDGEHGPGTGYKQSAILVQDGAVDRSRLVREFRRESKNLDAAVRQFVLERLENPD